MNTFGNEVRWANVVREFEFCPVVCNKKFDCGIVGLKNLEFCPTLALFTGFQWFVRHGCGVCVGWQMVVLCLSASSKWVSGGFLSVSVWLSCGVVWPALSWNVEFGRFGRRSVVLGVKFPFLVGVVQIVHVCWLGSWDDCPEWRGFVSFWISCSVHFCGFV